MKSSLLSFFGMVALALAVCASLPQQQAKADDSGGYDAIFRWEARDNGAYEEGIRSTFTINYYSESGGNYTYIGADVDAVATSTNSSGSYNATYTSHAPNGATYFNITIGIGQGSTKTGLTYDKGPGTDGFGWQLIIPGGTLIDGDALMTH